jgi:predicted metalloendopeptidase
MTQLSKKLESLIKNSKEILPVKTEQGILVGSILIVSKGPLKDLYHDQNCIYSDVSLNKIAIRLANMLARSGQTYQTDKIYRADQEYGRWFADSQMLRNQYQRAVNIGNFEKSDTLWARYCESRSKTVAAKNLAEFLANV